VIQFSLRPLNSSDSLVTEDLTMFSVETLSKMSACVGIGETLSSASDKAESIISAIAMLIDERVAILRRINGISKKYLNKKKPNSKVKKKKRRSKTKVINVDDSMDVGDGEGGTAAPSPVANAPLPPRESAVPAVLNNAPSGGLAGEGQAQTTDGGGSGKWSSSEVRARCMTLEGSGMAPEGTTYADAVVEKMSNIRYLAWLLMKYWILCVAAADASGGRGLKDELISDDTIKSVVSFICQTAKTKCLSLKTLQDAKFDDLREIVKSQDMVRFMDVVMGETEVDNVGDMSHQISYLATEMGTSFSNFYTEQAMSITTYYLGSLVTKNLSHKNLECAANRLGASQVGHHQDLINALIEDLGKEECHISFLNKECEKKLDMEGTPDGSKTLLRSAVVLLKKRHNSIPADLLKLQNGVKGTSKTREDFFQSWTLPRRKLWKER
jgi:hypothetical protein